MKKTFKKQLIFLAVITVMMICSLVMSASAQEAACPAYDDPTQAHASYYVITVTYEPTCTQKGYSVDYCEYCQRNVVNEYNYVDETGHNYTVSYRADGDGYKRWFTCQNEVCVKNADGTELKNTTDVDAAIYYSVSFISDFESPETTQADHANYFDSDYYVKNSPSTWLAVDYLEGTVYAPSKQANASAYDAEGNRILSPAYEYIEEADGIKLYVKQGEAAVYDGETPYRYKDAKIGEYTFSNWAVDGKTVTDAVTENTVFEAQFEANEDVMISYDFWANGSKLTTTYHVPYGGTVKYDLATPVKANDVVNSFSFAGWQLSKDGKVYNTTNAAEEMILYYDTSIHALFDTIPNTYTIKFVDYNGNEFANSKSEGVKIYSAAEGINAISSKMIERARDAKYIYTFAGSWEITACNGMKLAAGQSYTVNPQNVILPSRIAVLDADRNTQEIQLTGGEEITITPVYTHRAVTYYIPISIKTVYFEPEDLFEDNSMVRSDILDDFVIQVTDANGQYVAGGKTDAEGKFMLEVTYSDTLYITAVTENGKYRGEHTLNLSLVYDTVEFNGIGIAPRMTEEWADGNTSTCNCICHSFLSPIVIRIYNLLYRLFGIKYVCCEDMYATHAAILAYTK